MIGKKESKKNSHKNYRAHDSVQYPDNKHYFLDCKWFDLKGKRGQMANLQPS